MGSAVALDDISRGAEYGEEFQSLQIRRNLQRGLRTRIGPSCLSWSQCLRPGQCHLPTPSFHVPPALSASHPPPPRQGGTFGSSTLTEPPRGPRSAASGSFITATPSASTFRLLFRHLGQVGLQLGTADGLEGVSRDLCCKTALHFNRLSSPITTCFPSQTLGHTHPDTHTFFSFHKS